MFFVTGRKLSYNNGLLQYTTYFRRKSDILEKGSNKFSSPSHFNTEAERSLSFKTEVSACNTVSCHSRKAENCMATNNISDTQ
jgi:hypothetical protein